MVLREGRASAVAVSGSLGAAGPRDRQARAAASTVAAAASWARRRSVMAGAGRAGGREGAALEGGRPGAWGEGARVLGGLGARCAACARRASGGGMLDAEPRLGSCE